MGPIVNLRTARKQAKRHQAEQEAAQRRAAFGRTKAERMLQQAERTKGRQDLDGHRIQGKDEA